MLHGTYPLCSEQAPDWLRAGRDDLVEAILERLSAAGTRTAEVTL